MGKNEVEIIVTAEDKASGVLKGIGGALGGIGRVAAGAALGGVALVGGAFALAGRSAIDMNSNLETSTLQFETLMGDADRAREHVEGLFDFAATTPFETGPIIEASRVMQVFGGDALNTEENLTLVGDTAAAVGAPIEDIGFWVGRAYAAIQGGQPFGEAAQNLMQMGAVSPDVIAEMNRLADSGASADEIFAVLQGHMGGFAGAMEKQAGTWQGLMSTISDSLNMAAATALKPFFDLAKQGLQSLATWLNSPQVQAGIQRIVEGFTTLIAKVSEFVTNSVIPFVQQHGEALKNVILAIGTVMLATLIPAAISLVVSLAPIVLVVGAIAGVIALLRAAWESNWGDIQGKTAAVIAFIQNIIQTALVAIQGFWAAHGAAIMAAVQQAWQTIQTIIQTAINIIQTVVVTVLTAIQMFWQAHGAAILATATQFWNLIKGLIEGVVTQIKLIVDAFRAAFEGDWRRFGELLFEIWANAWTTVVNFLSGLWDMVVPWLNSLWERMKQWFFGTDWPALGRAIIQGIINGVRAMGDALGNVLQGIVDAAIRRIKSLLGITSPSRLMHYFGKMTGQGFIDGIESQIGAIERVMSDAFSATNRASNQPLALVSGAVGDSAPGSFAGRAFTGNTTVVNIDARGAARGVDRDLRAMVEQVMREYGVRADVRMRTS